MARRILALLLIAMAVGQISDVSGFIDIIETYDVGGRGAAWLVGSVLLVGESVAGVGLIRSSASATHRRASGLAVAVAVAWSALAVQAFARGLALDNCGCFGVHLAQQLRWWILLEDAEFVALAVWVFRDARRSSVEVAPAVGSESVSVDQ